MNILRVACLHRPSALALARTRRAKGGDLGGLVAEMTEPREDGEVGATASPEKGMPPFFPGQAGLDRSSFPIGTAESGERHRMLNNHMSLGYTDPYALELADVKKRIGNVDALTEADRAWLAVKSADDLWKCRKCWYRTPKGLTHCERCSTPRKNKSSNVDRPHWVCGSCLFPNKIPYKKLSKNGQRTMDKTNDLCSIKQAAPCENCGERASKALEGTLTATRQGEGDWVCKDCRVIVPEGMPCGECSNVCVKRSNATCRCSTTVHLTFHR